MMRHTEHSPSALSGAMGLPHCLHRVLVQDVYKRQGNADALALPAGKFVGEAAGKLRQQTYV